MTALTSPLVLLALLGSVSLAPSTAQPTPAASQDHDVKVSPFSGLRWTEAGEPEVQVRGTWYRPLRIDGLGVDRILAFCESRWPGQQRKRFGEDLIEAMVLMGHEPEDGAWRATTLVLETLGESPEEVTLAAIPMTRANRRAIRDASSARSSRPARPPVPTAIESDLAAQDVDLFAAKLKERFAYLETRGVDLDAELEAVKSSFDGEVPVASLQGHLRRVLLLFGDGHASVSGAPREKSLHLPFLLDQAGGGVVGFLPDRSGFVDPKRPFVHEIDGHSIEEWVDAVRPLVAAGSEALVRRRALGELREFELVRPRLDVPAALSLEVVVSTKPKGGTKKTLTLDLQERRPIYGTWPKTRTGRLEGKRARRLKGGIGVLRLALMDDDLIPELRDAMDSFRGTSGLVVDVRGNGGGRRGLLAALGGYLANGGPVVGNCAAYRLAPDFGEDHLGGSRLLYRATDDRWTDAQRTTIERFAAGFEPEWALPTGFSDWHYLILDRTGHPREFPYEKPVVVLTDSGCFSATDIFAAAMGELPTVTLLGTTTSGGSARVQRFRLPHSGLEVRCASMASFQPNGQLYDGHGVAPDRRVEKEPSDLLDGGTDAQLEAAVALIARKTR